MFLAIADIINPNRKQHLNILAEEKKSYFKGENETHLTRLPLLIWSLIVLLSLRMLLLSEQETGENSTHRLLSTGRHTPTSVLNPTEKKRNHMSTERQSGLFDSRKRD